MRPTVTNVCVKFNQDRLRMDKVLGNLKYDNNKYKKNNNVRGALGSPSVSQRSRNTHGRSQKFVLGGIKVWGHKTVQ